jgi:hypothetical protein
MVMYEKFSPCRKSKNTRLRCAQRANREADKVSLRTKQEQRYLSSALWTKAVAEAAKQELFEQNWFEVPVDINTLRTAVTAEI